MTRTGALPTLEHEVDLCIVGGGMAGVCAALAAARLGARVALVQDRPVLGGNSSSETRVHICGADRHNEIPNMRETGILEELRLENMRRNPNRSFSVWDTILYEKVRYEPNITLLLNCSCLGAHMDGQHITSVTGWQLTTQTYHEVRATIFADCSGDAILAPLTGALYRMGREGRAEYGETIAPEVVDEHTMGMTCLFQAREYPTAQPFEPPSWAYRFEHDSDLPYGAEGHRWWEMGYWWVELGGEHHAIHDTEALRDELLRIAFGVWDHVKNRGDHGAENWALEWVQFLPAKRESRRYVGDHVLTQLDIEAEGRFPDLVAYGGWTMDDHHPAGFWAAKLGSPATVFHPAPSPYGIPYRALYSRNIDNLMFAGRCASCTHAAMSSTRVMGTACSMGQAVGTAAALAAAHGLLPREVGQSRCAELQQSLLRQDCYLPWVQQRFSVLAWEGALSASRGDPSPLRDGTSRPVGTDLHAWQGHIGDSVQYKWRTPRRVAGLTLVLDSALSRNLQMSYHQRDDQLNCVPPEMARDLHIEVMRGGEWHTQAAVTGNYQRLLRIPLNTDLEALRVTFDATWGADTVTVFAFSID